MRGFLFWSLGALIAFAVTSGAFLLLADLGRQTSERSLTPRTREEPEPGPRLGLGLNTNQLEDLKPEGDQSLEIDVINRGDEKLGRVALTVTVESGNTAQPGTRRYEQTVSGIAADSSRTIRFDGVDLSPTGPPVAGEPGEPQYPQRIVEVRAAASGSLSTVKTAVLPLDT